MAKLALQYAQILMLAGLTAACGNSDTSSSSTASSSGGSSDQGGLAEAQSGGSGTGGGALGVGATGGFSLGSGGMPGASGGGPGAGGSGVGGQALGVGGAAAGGMPGASGGGPGAGGSGVGGQAFGVGGQAFGVGGAAAGGMSVASGGTSAGGASASGGAPAGGAGMGGDTFDTGGIGAGGDALGSGGAHDGTPSSGCSLTEVTTGTTLDNTMNVPGHSTLREYRLSVPSDYVPGEPLPVVFVLNGVGGTGPQAQQFFQVETGHRAIFVYPTSLPNDEAGGSIAWDFSLNGVDVPFFDEMVSYLEENYCVDMSRIFALGASSGGIMSNMLGCFRGDVFRAIAPSSGMTWQQSGCQGDVAVMVICGEQDSFNACDDGQNGGLSQTNVWVPLNGCTQPTQTIQSAIADICQEFQGCRAGDPLLLCKHAGGHGWPTSDGDFWWQFFMNLD